MFNGNYLILSSLEFSHFIKKYPFWDTFYTIEEIRDEFNEFTGEYITTLYVLRKKLKYIDLRLSEKKVQAHLQQLLKVKS